MWDVKGRQNMEKKKKINKKKFKKKEYGEEWKTENSHIRLWNYS